MKKSGCCIPLFQFSADKYCGLVEAEGGLKLLVDLLNHPSPYEMIKDLACVVIGNCARYANRVTPPPPVSPDN